MPAMSPGPGFYHSASLAGPPPTLVREHLSPCCESKSGRLGIKTCRCTAEIFDPILGNKPSNFDFEGRETSIVVEYAHEGRFEQVTFQLAVWPDSAGRWRNVDRGPNVAAPDRAWRAPYLAYG